MSKFEKQSRTLQIGLFMVQYPDWTHVRGNHYKYMDVLYDLTRIDLQKIDQVVNNEKYMIRS
jgi:hypothetical protein